MEKVYDNINSYKYTLMVYLIIYKSFRDQFEILDKIGQGGFGYVYQVVCLECHITFLYNMLYVIYRQ